MKRDVKKRLEELFRAEMLLSRIYLHLLNKERIDMLAVALVVIKYELITKEARKLRRSVEPGETRQ